MKTFEYVISGFGHTKIIFTNRQHGQASYQRVQAIIKDIIDYAQQRCPHDLSVLFNAFSERKFAEIFDVSFKGSVSSIFADSGGLQAITLGKAIDDKMKSAVYALQAKYSTRALGFDEIPIERGSDKTIAITDVDSKLFSIDLLDSCIKKTRSNLLEQIDYFQQVNTSCKILPIIQGNCFETYEQWYTGLLANLNTSQWNTLGGVAFAMAAFGRGPQEETERVFIIEKIVKEFNHLHLLGVGSINRLLPLLILKQNGLLSNITHISYDSTTHSSTITRGNYYLKGSSIKLGKHMPNRNSNLILENIYSHFEQLFTLLKEKYGFTFTEDEVYHNICQPRKLHEFNEKRYDHLGYCFIVLFIFALAQILNVCSEIDFLFKNPSYLKEHTERIDPNLLLLFQVKSLDDYSWFKDYMKYFKSKRIDKKENVLSIDSLF